MKDIIYQLGGKIKEIRKKSGLTQAELALKINVDPKYISRLETGTSTPSLAIVIKLAKVLDIDISDFFEIETKEKRNKIIDLINSKLIKANIRELNAIFEIIDIMTEK